MEVDGKKPDMDLPKSSDQETPPLCQICITDGEHLPAHGYCQTCQEYLCETCYKAHKLPRPSRNHVLLDKSQMPVTQVEPKQSPCTIECIKHPNEFVKFLCQSHDSVVCGVCAVLDHQKPCSLEYIPELKSIQTYRESTEYGDLVKRLEALEKDVKVCKADARGNEWSIDENIEAALDDIRALRTEVNTYLDTREEMLMTTAKQMRKDDHSLRTNLVSGLETLDGEIDKAQHKLTSLQNDTSNLFVASKQIHKQVSEFEKNLNKYVTQNTTPGYIFKRDPDLQRIISSNGTLGTLERSFEARHLPLSVSPAMTTTLDFRKVSVTQMPDINMKITRDGTRPSITALAFLPPNTLITIDRDNFALKTVDTTTNTVTSQLTFNGKPLDIALLPGDQVAVTIPGKKRIQIISTKDGYSCLKSMTVDGECRGICSTNQHIVVSYVDPGMIQVMDLAGNVMHTLSTDDKGAPLFRQPIFITVSIEESGEFIYVSDCSTNTVTKVSMTGTILSTYKHTNWKELGGLIYVGQGQLLVNNSWGPSIDVVSVDGKNVDTLLDKTHGIQHPRALCYCASQKTLYVSNNRNGERDSCLVFKMAN